MARVLVTGATGSLGRAVVSRLQASGHTTRGLTHSKRGALPAGAELVIGDLARGDALAAALVGVDAIIHCATNPRHARSVDLEGARRMLAATGPARPHLIYPSIVGIDRSTHPYYQTKRAVEALIEHGPLPWSVLRATQFHDFVVRLIKSFRDDTRNEIVIPGGMRFQSVDVDEVADRLVSLVESGAAGRAADLGGPAILAFEDMTARYLHVRGGEATIRQGAVEDELYDVFRSGVNLLSTPGPGVVTWDTYLRRRFSHDATAR